jgi:hypothetical protein
MLTSGEAKWVIQAVSYKSLSSLHSLDASFHHPDPSRHYLLLPVFANRNTNEKSHHPPVETH